MTSILKRSELSQQEEQKYLDTLNKHFDAVTCEKHPNAMFTLIFNEAYDKILGKNFRKERISKRKQIKLREEVVTRLRRKYGRWINLTNFKAKNPYDISFLTNFNRVYRIKNIGILYGSPSEMVCEGIFYTSHCLERFEERADPELYKNVTEALTRIYKTKPTSADIMMGLILTSNYEYGKWKSIEYEDNKLFYYLNVSVGALALEDLGDLFIAKTFLTPDMLHPEMKWLQPLFNEEDEISSFKELLNLDTIKIDEPTLIYDEIVDAIVMSLFNREGYIE